jgi:hypothetical protein
MLRQRADGPQMGLLRPDSMTGWLHVLDHPTA